MLFEFSESLFLVLLRVDDVLVERHGVRVGVLGQALSVLLLLLGQLAARRSANRVRSMVYLRHGFESNWADGNLRWSAWLQNVVVDLRHHPLSIFILLRGPCAFRLLDVSYVLLSTDDVVVDTEVGHEIWVLHLDLGSDIWLMPRCLLWSWWTVG